MTNNNHARQYSIAPTFQPEQAAPAQHPPEHPASPSSDSSPSQAGAEVFAELIRSGATENPAKLDVGVIGPRISKSKRGLWISLPDRGSRPTNSEGPMPPPVQGFAGATRPRYGQATTQDTSAAEVDTLANTNGPAAAFLGTGKDPVPRWMPGTQHGSDQPKLQEVMEDLPFIEACRAAVPSTAFVIKIKNPPYLTNRGEILALMGRSADICPQPPGSQFFAVHIITNRFNGATMDAFVEVATKAEAVRIVNHFDKRRNEGKPSMIGDRECFISLSSQEELMEELFPRAKFTSWQGAGPKVSGLTPMYYSDTPSTGFDGFFDPEELALMQKYAETPQRSPYATKCHIRVYETLISVLHKYPWSAPELVLMREREALFNVVKKSIRSLIVLFSYLRNGQQEEKTEPKAVTLQELVVAVLTCPGFSETQKAKVVLDVAQAGYERFLSSRGMELRFGGVHQFAKHWPFKALVMKPSVPDGLVEQVISLLKQALVNSDVVSGFEAYTIVGLPNRFPDLKIDYNHTKTLADVAVVEKQHIEGVLRFLLLSLDRTPRKVHTFTS